MKKKQQISALCGGAYRDVLLQHQKQGSWPCGNGEKQPEIILSTQTQTWLEGPVGSINYG